MKTHDVAVVGEIYIDHIFTGFDRWPQPGEEVYAPHYTREVGGGAAITACALAKLGRSVDLVGIIGAGDAGWIRDRLRFFGVCDEHLAESEGSTGVTVAVSIREERSFFSHLGANRILQEMLTAEAALAVLGKARHVHFALPLRREPGLRLLSALRAQGCSTSLDVGFHPEWLQAPPNLDICRAVDYFLPNEKEAALFCGAEGLDYLTYARQHGLMQPVVKLGRSGAAMISDHVRYQASPPPVSVIDTTGAGDVFDAGFIDAHLDGLPPQDCLRRASACGALSTRSAGALSALPARPELERIFGQAHGT